MSKRSTFAADCLKGRVVLITGAAGAIGVPIVEALIDHGARVAACDVIPQIEASQRLPKSDACRYFRCDITSEPQVHEMFAAVATSMGEPDAVLCHAGTVQAHPVDQFPLEAFQQIMSLNVAGSFLTAREAARRMKGKRSADNPGKIIFTSSWVEDVPWPEISAYTASKAAVRMLMRNMARELAADHILVNSVAPGIVAVGLAKRQWDTDPSYRARAEKAIPLGTMQPPNTVADAMLFLCSDASNYMTGSTLLVDGGCSLYPMI
jgi:NAD(P)-dependent dehydrogenase (short-subunit alcohol dehydrogenase family)